jgi:nicotinamidase-related amidase
MSDNRCTKDRMALLIVDYYKDFMSDGETL